MRDEIHHNKDIIHERKPYFNAQFCYFYESEFAIKKSAAQAADFVYSITRQWVIP